MRPLALACLVALVGCSTITTSYTSQVVTPRKDRPVFTIIPKSLTASETNLASEIERCLLSERIAVIERPVLVQAEVNASENESRGRDSGEWRGTLEGTIDVVATYANSKADIIVAADSDSRRVKFLDRRESNRILRTGQIPAQNRTVCRWLHDNLVAIGYGARRDEDH